MKGSRTVDKVAWITISWKKSVARLFLFTNSRNKVFPYIASCGKHKVKS